MSNDTRGSLGKSANATRRRRAVRPVHFVVRQLHRGCWVVACEGRWIAGAVLSSLPAAAAYAGEIARASGWPNFLLSVAAGSGRLG